MQSVSFHLNHFAMYVDSVDSGWVLPKQRTWGWRKQVLVLKYICQIETPWKTFLERVECSELWTVDCSREQKTEDSKLKDNRENI